MKHILMTLALALSAVAVQAKLPPLSDEAKAKAAEAAAKTAHGNKVAAYQLCKSNERVADHYRASAKKAGKEPGAQVETPACADPGPYVPAPVVAGAVPAAPAAPAAPAPATATAAKKP
ncbi:hypothetical protein [Ideonella sp.]|jgi:hypothetical protein|uniref:hypothetical protein n=1 Tax=Ideonella sp. TaxID=1929293 RepID=UPI0037BF053B